MSNRPQWLGALPPAAQLARLLGKRTLTAIERLMGLILTAVAVQMLINGIEQAYQTIAQTR